MPHPLVVNKRTAAYDIYVGRGSKWGNPWVIGEMNEETGKPYTRDECLKMYARWLLTRDDLLAAIPELRGARLGCWCAPQRCHADTLARLANKRIKMGFTGTRRGMTDVQSMAVQDVIRNVDDVHHGDCVGADDTTHILAMHWEKYIVIHPPTDDKQRVGHYAPEVRCEKPYIERNHDIVDETDWLLAAPGEMEEQLRSGTWATVRYARKCGKRVVLAMPDGSVVVEEGKA